MEVSSVNLQLSFSLLVTFLCEHHSSWTPFTYSIGKFWTERVRKKKTSNRKNSGNRAHVWHFLLDPQPWIMVESYIHCSANIFTFHCKVCHILQTCNSVMVHLKRWTWMDLKLSNCCEVQQTFKREKVRLTQAKT